MMVNVGCVYVKDMVIYKPRRKSCSPCDDALPEWFLVPAQGCRHRGGVTPGWVCADLALSIGGGAKVLDDVGVPQPLQDGALPVEVLQDLRRSRVQDLHGHQHAIPAPLVHLDRQSHLGFRVSPTVRHISGHIPRKSPHQVKKNKDVQEFLKEG